MKKQQNQKLLESRTARSNIAVRHPARWVHFAELLLAPATRLHRYRDLNRRLVENTLDDVDCRQACQ